MVAGRGGFWESTTLTPAGVNTAHSTGVQQVSEGYSGVS